MTTKLEQQLEQANADVEAKRAALAQAHADHDAAIAAADAEHKRCSAECDSHFSAFRTVSYEIGVRLGILNADVAETDRYSGYHGLNGGLNPIVFTSAFNAAVLEWAGLGPTEFGPDITWSRGDDLFLEARRALSTKLIAADQAYHDHEAKTRALRQAQSDAQRVWFSARLPIRNAENALKDAEEAANNANLKVIGMRARREERAETRDVPTVEPKAPKVSAADKERFVNARRVLGEAKTRHAKAFTWGQK